MQQMIGQWLSAMYYIEDHNFHSKPFIIFRNVRALIM